MVLIAALAAFVAVGARVGGALVQRVIDRPSASENLWRRHLAPRPGGNHEILLLGNSRLEAAVDVERLGAALAANVDPYFGAGWDAVHYDMMSTLAAEALRPGRDAVVIEASPLALDDSAAENHLDFVRPEAALEIATLPGAPIETRLDVLLGAAAPLYRYREWLLAIDLSHHARAAISLLRRMNLFGPAPREPAFRVDTVPGHALVIRGIEGDGEAFTRANRARLDKLMAELRVGGWKLTALRRAVSRLRARGIAVILVVTPSGPWLSERLAASGAAGRVRTALRALAVETGAVVLDDWPAELRASSAFWDESHLAGATARSRLTDLLVAAIRRTLEGGGG